MKKILVLILACSIVLSFAGCAGGGGVDVFKVGMILPGQKDASDMKEYAQMVESAAEECSIDEENVKIEYGVLKNDECTKKAKELSKDGCDVIFVVTDGEHTDCVKKAAEECPADVFVLIADENKISEKISYGNVKYAFVNGDSAEEGKENEEDKETASDAQSGSDADKKPEASELGVYIKKVISDAKAGKTIDAQWAEPKISSDADSKEEKGENK